MRSGGSAVIGDLIPEPMSSGGDQSTEPCASAAPGITTKPLVPIGFRASWQSPLVQGVSDCKGWTGMGLSSLRITTAK